ncbi:MAG: hypothetical protein V4697_03340 [Patescibacteria group bacterium]
MNTDEMFDQAMIEHKQEQARRLKKEEEDKQAETEKRQQRRKEIDKIFKSAQENLAILTKPRGNKKFRDFLQHLLEKKGDKHYRGSGRTETWDFFLCLPREKDPKEIGETGSVELFLVWDRGDDVSQVKLETKAVRISSGIAQYDYPFGPTLEEHFYPHDSYKKVLLLLSQPESAIKFLIKQS